METSQNYQQGLLHLLYLLITSDGEISSKELQYLNSVRDREGIDNSQYAVWQTSLIGRTERQIYQNGIQLINSCADDQKLRAFVKLYKMAESDGRIHVREVRLLLYAIKLSNIEFDDVVSAAMRGE